MALDKLKYDFFSQTMSEIKSKRFVKFRQLVRLNPPLDATGRWIRECVSPELFDYYYRIGIRSVYKDGEIRTISRRRIFCGGSRARITANGARALSRASHSAGPE